MSEISASTDLGNGFGCVYITDDSGALGTVWGYPQGIVNNILAVNAIKKDFGPRNSRYAGAGYAVGYMTLTNAAADNLNTLTSGGVNQISGAVAMTAGTRRQGMRTTSSCKTQATGWSDLNGIPREHGCV